VVELLDALHLPLVNRFYKSCRYSAKAGRGEQVFVLREKGAIKAALRLVPKPDSFRFLRSMCVAPECRRQGLGLRLLQEIETDLDRSPLYCFPFDHLQSFYETIGFELRSPDDVPAFIRDPFDAYVRQGKKILIMTRQAA
jgi:N-acetylglutamate synthase-like GNAT family acetyltransferase